MKSKDIKNSIISCIWFAQGVICYFSLGLGILPKIFSFFICAISILSMIFRTEIICKIGLVIYSIASLSLLLLILLLLSFYGLQIQLVFLFFLFSFDVCTVIATYKILE